MRSIGTNVLTIENQNGPDNPLRKMRPLKRIGAPLTRIRPASAHFMEFASAGRARRTPTDSARDTVPPQAKIATVLY
jgi:hypothetical protein